MKKFFGIIGGMGTLASTQFINDMNRYFSPDGDQKYLNYFLMNYADIPDRTAYILDNNNENPTPYLIDAVKKVEILGAKFVVIACNTAHYYIDDIKKATNIPILNMLETVSDKLSEVSADKIGIMATSGTLESKLYHQVIESVGKEVIEPTEELQRGIMSLIYDDVKENKRVDVEKFKSLVEAYKILGAEAVILGCTELSYVNSHIDETMTELVDSQQLTVMETIRRARIEQNK